MKAKEKKTVFICQLTESFLKVAKCLLNHNSKRRFVGLEVEEIVADTDDKKLAEKFNAAFKKLGYRNDPVIISLPRSQATCRYIKVPAQAPDEIERIISLQASRYLPYPAGELITSYQAILSDKEGFTYINLVIVHRDIVERYLKIFQEANINRVTIALSSYGLCNFYNYLEPEGLGSVMVIDIDSEQVELAIILNKKLVFSRCFKLNQLKADWGNLFIDELNKTQDAYLKELSQETPDKVILMGVEKKLKELAEIIKKQVALPVEIFSCAEKINIPENLSEKILNSDNSFTSLIGLGLERIEESLNLLPQGIKTEVKKVSQRNEYLKLILYILGIILFLSLGVAKNLHNKAIYLEQLKSELNKIAQEARPLEEIEKRFGLLQNRSQARASSLDLLYEIFKTMPPDITLSSFSYEEDNQVILRGQTPELNSVYTFVTELQNSEVFKNFSIKPRYATKKKTQAGEIMDIEIVCSKK